MLINSDEFNQCKWHLEMFGFKSDFDEMFYLDLDEDRTVYVTLPIDDDYFTVTISDVNAPGVEGVVEKQTFDNFADVLRFLIGD